MDERMMGAVGAEGVKAFLENMLEGNSVEDARFARLDASHEAVLAALARPRLKGLTPGMKIRQKKFGADYMYVCNDREVFFVRYLTDVERAFHMRKRPDSPGIEDADVVISFGVSRSDGSLVSFLASSEFFDRVLTQGEKILAEIEAEDAAKKQ